MENEFNIFTNWKKYKKEKQNQIQILRDEIEYDIGKLGGIEKFNECDYAHEIISIWIGKILDIL